jgi:heat shock protein HslJ
MKKQLRNATAGAQPNRFPIFLPALTLAMLCTTVGVWVSKHPQANAQDAVIHSTPSTDLPMENWSSNSRIGPTWALLSWQESGRAQNLVTGKLLTVTFTQDRISGSGGCNRYSASYQVKSSDHIAVGAVMSTRMACIEPELMQQEAKFLAALKGAQILKSDRQGHLILQYTTEEGEKGSLTFKANSATSASESNPCNR